ncbi:MAG: hypothetical protein R2845_05850 [Thermomicrobiales bacterium]
MDAHALIDQLDTALEKALGEDEFDLGFDEESGAIELATDEWTLVLSLARWHRGFWRSMTISAGFVGRLMTAIELLIGPALAPIKDADVAAEVASQRRSSAPSICLERAGEPASSPG